MTTLDGRLLDEVRSALEQGRSAEDARSLRRRLFRAGLLALVSLVTLVPSWHISRMPGWAMIAVIAAIVSVLLLLRYRELGVQPPRAASHDEVIRVAKKSSRCPRCGRLVLPVEQDECLACGALVKPGEAILVMAAVLALIVGTTLWRVYH